MYFKERLKHINPEYPFSSDDFNVLPEHRKALLYFLREEYRKGNIGKLERGIYYIPAYIPVMGDKKLPPSSFAIYEYLKKRDNGYLTGASIHSGLRLNTQICGGIIYASDRKPKDFKLGNIRFIRVKASVPDEEIVEKNHYLLQILDCMNEIEFIPDCHPDDAVYVLKRHLKKLSAQQIVDMERLSGYYRVRVRALRPAMPGSINSENKKTAIQASERLCENLPRNRKNKFMLLTDQELRNMKKFNIHEFSSR